MQLPEFLEQGEQARLFSVGSTSNKERRVTSTLLAILPVFPELAERLLRTISFRLGKKATIRTFTEVVLRGSEKDRPDGLLIIEQSKKTFSVLVEAKVDKAQIDSDQLQRYLRIAAENKIDAVLTISNQFVSNPTISPVKEIPKSLLRKTQLYHWSWTSVLTQSQLLRSDQSLEDREKMMLLDELIRYFAHPSTGIETFTQMNAGWKEIVKTVGTGGRLSPADGNLQDAVDAWIQEERDLSLLLSRIVRQTVTIALPRKLQADADSRRKSVKDELIAENLLKSGFRVPNAADDINVTVDLARKSISVKMNLRAPEDKKSTSARVNWLLRMLKEEDDRIHIRAHWPSRVQFTQEHLSRLRKTPELIQTENSKLAPVSFDVLLIEDMGGRFSGRKTFIEDLERIVPDFYKMIGQHLRAWQKRPPKIESSVKEPEDDTASSEEPTIISPDNMDYDDREKIDQIEGHEHTPQPETTAPLDS